MFEGYTFRRIKLSKNQAIENYLMAVNDENFEMLMSLFSSDAILISGGSGTRTGIERIMTFYRNFFIKFPQHHDVPVRILECGDVVVVEIAFTGRSNKGATIAFSAVDIFDFENGKITSLNQWVDTAAIEKILH
jgi:ketosteroid isomerase-like protein